MAFVFRAIASKPIEESNALLLQSTLRWPSSKAMSDAQALRAWPLRVRCTLGSGMVWRICSKLTAKVTLKGVSLLQI